MSPSSWRIQSSRKSGQMVRRFIDPRTPRRGWPGNNRAHGRRPARTPARRRRIPREANRTTRPRARRGASTSHSRWRLRSSRDCERCPRRSSGAAHRSRRSGQRGEDRSRRADRGRPTRSASSPSSRQHRPSHAETRVYSRSLTISRKTLLAKTHHAEPGLDQVTLARRLPQRHGRGDRSHRDTRPLPGARRHERLRRQIARRAASVGLFRAGRADEGRHSRARTDDASVLAEQESEAREPMADDIRARIDGLVQASNVMLFMKGTKQFPACGFSNAVIQILKKEGVPFETFNILADPEVRQGLKEYSNWPTFPQLYVAGKFVGGCDIVTEMHQTGELAAQLTAAGVK